MKSLLLRLIPLTFLLVVANSVIADELGSEYETIRFFNSRSKPEKLKSYAISPNGRLLAMSFSRDFGGRKGISIIDLEKKDLVSQVANVSYFTLALSCDSRNLLGMGGYAQGMLHLLQLGAENVNSATKSDAAAVCGPPN